MGLGQCSADEVLAAMLLDARERLRVRGLLGKGAFQLPLTQQDIGDYLGMTPVDVNRMLARLRRPGTIASRRHVVLLRDSQALERTASPDAGRWGRRASPLT